MLPIAIKNRQSRSGIVHASDRSLYNAGTLEAPEGATAAELSPMQPPTPSDIQADGDALESPTAADMPAGSQAAASVSTPQHNAGAAAGNCSAETPTMPFPPFGGRGDALISVSTPEHGPGPQSEEGPSVQTPVPAEGASEAGGPASARVKTPVPGPSPQLPGQPDLITPPPQILGNMETPDLDASHHMQQDTPDEAPEAFMQQEVQSSPTFVTATHSHAFPESLQCSQQYASPQTVLGGADFCRPS